MSHTSCGTLAVRFYLQSLKDLAPHLRRLLEWQLAPATTYGAVDPQVTHLGFVTAVADLLAILLVRLSPDFHHGSYPLLIVPCCAHLPLSDS